MNVTRRKKAILLAVLCLLPLLLCGCGEEKTVPKPEVEAFLNTEISGEKAVKDVATASYTVTETRENKAGEELGRTEYAVTLDRSNEESLYLHILQTYTGNAVEDGISEKEVTLEKTETGYLYTTRLDQEVNTEAVEDTFAVDYLNSFFFTDNGAYKEGGLYYGDFFLLYIYKYPETSFSVEGDTCVFDEKMSIYQGEDTPIWLHQRAVINPLGLLLEEYERYETEDSELILVSQLQAEYTYLTEGEE